MGLTRACIRRLVFRAALVGAFAGGGYGALLLHPQPLFAFSARAGLYLRYHLLVAYLLDRQGMSAETSLGGPIPPDRIERALKESVTGGNHPPEG